MVKASLGFGPFAFRFLRHAFQEQPRSMGTNSPDKTGADLFPAVFQG